MVSLRVLRCCVALVIGVLALVHRPALAKAQEYAPARLGIELSTLAYGVNEVFGDDSHYGANDVFAAPGFSLSAFHRVHRHFALGVALEGQAVMGTDQDASGEVRTHHLGRAELVLAGVAPLGSGWELWPGLGIGADLGRFDVGYDDFAGQGMHVSSRNTLTYAMNSSWGLSATGSVILAGVDNRKPSDSYIDGAGVVYLYASLMIGVVWWPE